MASLSRLSVYCAAIALLAAQTASFGVLPTVNKITLSTGEWSSGSPYAGVSSPPAGIWVAAGDVNGDGLADLVTSPTTGQPKVEVRGWDYKSKSATIPTFSRGYRNGGIGHFPGDTGNTVFHAASGPDGTSIEIESWSWGDTSSGPGLVGGGHVGVGGYDLDRPFGVAASSVGIAPAWILLGQRSIQDQPKGFASIIRRDGAPVTSFEVFPNTYGGGVRVATGDVDNDGFDDVVAIARNKQPRNGGIADCIAFAICDTQGRVKVKFPWLTESDTTVAPDGSLTGRVAVGDVDGDGRAEIIATKATANGPLCTIFDVLGGDDGTPLRVDAGTPISLSIAGLPPIGDPLLAFCALEVSFTPLALEPVSPNGNNLVLSGGTLVFGLSVVPEPTSLAAIAGAAILLGRRRS